MAQFTGNRYAVIVGIDSYKDQNIPGLKCAGNDAKAIYEFLTNPAQGAIPEKNVSLLINEEANLMNIRSKLGGTFLPRLCQPNDTVIIYWSGHGCPDILAGTDKVAKYLIPYDAKIDDLYSTAFPMEEIATVFNRIRAERTVFFMDTCFSGLAGGRTFMGPGFRGAGILLDTELVGSMPGTGRIIISACGLNELAKEDEARGHGVFTEALLEGLEGKADLDGDRFVEVKELFSYLEHNVPPRAQELGGNQNPMWKGEVKGSIYLSQTTGGGGGGDSESKKPKVPIIAFFGCKGGVGKTTLSNIMADLVAVAPSGPNVLVIDMDHTVRSTTEQRTYYRFTCRTIHGYVKMDSIKDEDVEAEDVTDTIARRGGLVGDPESWGKGHVYVIPSADKDDIDTWQVMAKSTDQHIYQVLRTVIDAAVKKYNISCVVMDCTPDLGRYTAAPAHVASDGFIVRDHLPECDKVMERYRPTLKEFFPDFDANKMHNIYNKAVGTVKSGGYFIVIPYTPDLIVMSGSLLDVGDVQMMLFHQYCLEMVRRLLGKTHPQLIPQNEVIVSKSWMEVIKQAPKLRKSSRFQIPKWLIGIGAAAIAAWAAIAYGLNVDQPALMALPVAGVLLGFLGFTQWQALKEHRKHLDGLLKDGVPYLLEKLATQSGQEGLSKLRSWAKIPVKM